MNKILILCFLLLTISCSKSVDTFNNENPFSIEIKRERSIHLAYNIKERLDKIGYPSYVIKHQDSTANDGVWYHIAYGSFSTEDSSKKVIKELEEEFKFEGLKIIKFDDFQNSILNVDISSSDERKRINAKKPSLSDNIYQVIEKFPDNKTLLIQDAYIFNTDNIWRATKDTDLDLPRGITKNIIKNNMYSWAEIIYQDNLFNDRVTIDIGKIKNEMEITKASFINVDFNNEDIASEYSDLILNTGEYLSEKKNRIEIDAYSTLSGYQVIIEPRKDYFRSYLVLTDSDNEFLFVCQSTDKNLEELISIISDIGNGDGLLAYNEFFNSFYTLPNDDESNDRFIGYSMTKLDWSYARRRDYSDWSKKMVGHWKTTFYMEDKDNRSWSYSLFDLLNPQAQNFIYGNLYLNDNNHTSNQRIDIYGVKGISISRAEVNFGYDRYIIALEPKGSNITNEELVLKAEKLQLNKNYN